uniref:Ig-like domain-containing protein n=1 Tax=Equus asinus TaxID=9793 RepID=A0A9L0IAD4_EQUAS
MEKHLRTSLVVFGKNQGSPQSLIVLEGENCTFQCNYTVSPFNNLRWYKWDTGRGLVSQIIMTYSERKKLNGRYTATLDATTMCSSLHITAAQLSDPAVYICAVDAVYSPDTCSHYPNLHLEVVKEA